MTEIVFNEYNYADASVACALLSHRNSEVVASWIGRACNLLKENNIEISDIYNFKSMDIATTQKSGKFHLIGHRSKPDNYKELEWLATKEGLILLAVAAKIMGHTVEAADRLLLDLGADVLVVNREIEPILARRNAAKEAKKREFKKERKKVLVESAQEELLVAEASDQESLVEDACLSQEDEDDLAANPYPEVTALAELALDPCHIYTWRGLDVILSSAYAKLCDVKTSRINQQIKRTSERGLLTDGKDFIQLDYTKADVFCDITNCDINIDERKRGIYLLTQVGVNNLSRHLNNARALAHGDGVSSAAVVIQDLERKGTGSFWFNPNMLIKVIQSLLDTHNKQLDNNERLLLAYESATQTHKELVESLKTLQETKFLGVGTGGVKMDDVRGLIDKTLDARIYGGESEIPAYLIGNVERRKIFFPAVSSAVVSKFLDRKGHENVEWSFKDDRGFLQKTESYLREGMPERQAEFFKGILHIRRTPLKFKCEHKDGFNFEIMRLPSGKRPPPDFIVRQELEDFMCLLTRFHTGFRYNTKTRELQRTEDVASFTCDVGGE